MTPTTSLRVIATVEVNDSPVIDVVLPADVVHDVVAVTWKGD